MAESHCMSCGMLEIGKLKPESVNGGLTTKKLVANACCWVEQIVEINRPIPSTLRR